MVFLQATCTLNLRMLGKGILGQNKNGYFVYSVAIRKCLSTLETSVHDSVFI